MFKKPENSPANTEHQNNFRRYSNLLCPSVILSVLALKGCMKAILLSEYFFFFRSIIYLQMYKSFYIRREQHYFHTFNRRQEFMKDKSTVFHPLKESRSLKYTVFFLRTFIRLFSRYYCWVQHHAAAVNQLQQLTTQLPDS